MSATGTRHEIEGVVYTVGTHIGQGGTSDVVQASDSDGRIVALKVHRMFQPEECEAMSDKVSMEARMAMQ
jgi:RIO-like serine/threonine protein kinase